MRSGKPVNQNAVLYLASHPEYNVLSDLDLAHLFKDLGYFAKTTYVRDIRITRIRLAAAQLAGRKS